MVYFENDQTAMALVRSRAFDWANGARASDFGQ